ncbi:MFS transporter [Bacillus thuringiensis]|uniref:MFS transporter n=1 Tax=Bacillus thuringiensis TaxID=1428 RepID=UPI002FBD2FF6
MDKPKLWSKNFILITLSNFFLFLGFQMLLPTIPIYVKSLGALDGTVGIVASIISISGILTRFGTGNLLDTTKRKMLFLSSQIILLIVFGAYYFAGGVILVAIIRFLHGIGWGIATTVNGASVGSFLPESRRGEGFGYYGLSTTLAMAIGPFLALELVQSSTYKVVFVIAFLSTIISVIFSYFVDRPNGKRVYGQRVEEKPIYFERKLIFPCFLLLLVTIAYSGIVNFLSLYGIEKGFLGVSLFFVINALSAFTTQFFAGRIFDAKGPSWILVPAGISLIISLFLIWIASSVYVVWIAGIFFGLGLGSVTPSIQSWVNILAGPNRGGMANMAYFNAFDIGLGFGSLVLSVIAGLTSYTNMYGFSVLLIFMFTISILVQANKQTKQKSPIKLN